MREFDKCVIQEQLAAITKEAIVSAEIERMADDINAQGRPFLARDRFRGIYYGRLRTVLASGGEGTDIHTFYESVVRGLTYVAPDEPLYMWDVRTASRRIKGISTPARLLGLFPDELMPDAAKIT